MLLPILILAMQAPNGQRGFDLLQSCLTTIRFIDGRAETRNIGEAAESNLCTSYIGGFIDATTNACPNGVMTGTVVRLYVEHMQKHPEDKDKYKAVGVERTLRENYPCKK